MAVNCQRCGTSLAADDWFCSHCGKERPQCPDCGAEMDDQKCKNCGTPRQAPCGNCGLLIDATLTECPNCGYNESEEVSGTSAGRKKKALALAGAGVVAFFLVGAVVPGPDIIGTVLGAIVALPLLSWGGLIAFYYSRKESKATDLVAASLKKGREQNKSKAWREKEKEQRKQAMEAVGNVASAAGEAASSYAEKKKAEQEQETAAQTQVTSGTTYNTYELEKSPKRVVLDMNCPNCGQRWRVVQGTFRSSQYRLDGAHSIDDLEAIGSSKVQCDVCNQTEYIKSFG